MLELRSKFIRYSLFIVAVLFIACSSTDTNNQSQVFSNIRFDSIIPKYAKSFCILDSDSLTKLVVVNPWQGAKGKSFEYLLSKHKADNTIQTPVKKVVCLSSTHISMLDALDENDAIVGVSSLKYVYNTSLTHAKEIGSETNVNIEMIINLQPDVVICYGVTSEISQTINRLKELGVPVIINADYLENNPLGRTEWVKFIAELFDKREMADSIFRSIETKYLNQKTIASIVNEKPRVLSGLPWQGVWYVPGGESYMAHFIKDAGGDYLWSDDRNHESMPKSLEEAYNMAQHADVWINVDAATSKTEILAVDNRMEDMKVFDKKIYNNNKRTNFKGCNDYFESSIMNPHLVLNDLIHIFHNLNPISDSLYYYKKIK